MKDNESFGQILSNLYKFQMVSDTLGHHVHVHNVIISDNYSSNKGCRQSDIDSIIHFLYKYSFFFLNQSNKDIKKIVSEQSFYKGRRKKVQSNVHITQSFL